MIWATCSRETCWGQWKFCVSLSPSCAPKRQTLQRSSSSRWWGWSAGTSWQKTLHSENVERVNDFENADKKANIPQECCSDLWLAMPWASQFHSCGSWCTLYVAYPSPGEIFHRRSKLWVGCLPKSRPMRRSLQQSISFKEEKAANIENLRAHIVYVR